MLDEKKKRIRGTLGVRAVDRWDGEEVLFRASPQIISKKTAARWASDGRSPKNMVVVAR